MEISTIIRNYIRTFGVSDTDFLTGDDRQLIASALTHKEEKVSSQRDEWGNWEYHLSKNNYAHPWLDRLVLKRMQEQGIEKKTIWPDGCRFAFCLTHDVDVISQNDYSQLSRRYRKLAMSSKSAVETAKMNFYRMYTALKSSLHPVKNDPLWCFEKWDQAELSFGFTSTYYIYIATSGMHHFDCDIAPDDHMEYSGIAMTFSEYIKLLCRNGNEIGLHGSYFTATDERLFRKQLKELEAIIAQPVTTTRQHFLHYDINSTPSIHQKCSIHTDSTLGFNRTVGFRAGTCHPYFIGNGLLEVPQIVMDGALFNANSLALDEKGACRKIIEVLDLVEEAGGCLTVNYHPNYLKRPEWWNSYLFLLQELKKRQAWCGSMENIYKLVNEKCAD